MNDAIVSFLRQQHAASICCVNGHHHPWCFSCFYAFNSEKGFFYFKSSEEALHTSILQNNPIVAGTILPDKQIPMLVKGVQFEGVIIPDDVVPEEKASLYYHKKHPMALAMAGHVWTLQINHIKMTDSSFGFGKKINWKRIKQEVLV